MPLPPGLPCVSGVTFPKPAWRYLLLFQSWSQLQNWALFIIATNVVVNSVLSYFGTHVLPVESILIGTMLGSLGAVIAVLPTEFVVHSSSDRLFPSLTNKLEGLGYVLLDSQADIVIYRQNLPRLLRWDEGNVEIERTVDHLIVKGPFMIVKKVRHSVFNRVAI